MYKWNISPSILACKGLCLRIADCQLITLILISWIACVYTIYSASKYVTTHMSDYIIISLHYRAARHRLPGWIDPVCNQSRSHRGVFAGSQKVVCHIHLCFQLISISWIQNCNLQSMLTVIKDPSAGRVLIKIHWAIAGTMRWVWIPSQTSTILHCGRSRSPPVLLHLFFPLGQGLVCQSSEDHSHTQPAHGNFGCH